MKCKKSLQRKTNGFKYQQCSTARVLYMQKWLKNEFWECFHDEDGNNEVLVGNDFYLIADRKNG